MRRDMMRYFHHEDEADTLKRLALGAAAGLAGTLFLRAVMAGHSKVSPRTMSPIRQDPGEYMVRHAKMALSPAMRDAIPPAMEKVATKSAGIGYGMLFGAIYGLFHTGEKIAPETTIAEGFVLGLGSWATGFLGWLPATKLMPPIWKQAPAQAILPAVEHAAFGMATAATYDLLNQYV